MPKKIQIDAEINLKVKSSNKEIEKIKQDMKNINPSLPGLTPDTMNEYSKLGDELDRIKKNAEADLLTGAITNPENLTRYINEVNAVGESMRNLTNDTLLTANTNKKFDKALSENAKSITAIEKAIKEKNAQLADTKELTESVTKAELDASRKTGISVKNLQDPDQIQKEIDKRKGDSGKPLSIEAGKEIRTLEGVLKTRKELFDTSGDILETQRELEDELKKETRELEEQLKIRREIIETELNRKKTVTKTVDGKKVKEEVDVFTKDQKKATREMMDQEDVARKLGSSLEDLGLKKHTHDINENVKANNTFTKTLGKKKKSFLENVTAATIYFAAIRAVRQIIREVTKTVNSLDKSFTEIAMVTNLTRQQTWKLVDGYQNLAREVGTTTQEVARLAVFFARQGKSASEALEMTKVAAIAAKVASIDATQSANFLTSAINGFGLATSEAMAISDKFAALGASSASSYEEMAIALSKVAPVAKTAGVSIDQMMGFLAKGIETTREAPENIGTAFKTVFARMTQLRDFGKTLEEGVAVNTVEEALATAGVSLRDSQGTFRDMGDVLTELGGKFDDLGRNQQAYIATALAGTRQQSRLLAVLQDFGRTQELVNNSVESAGATLAQHAEFSEGMEAANARLAVSFEKVITSFTDADTIVAIINSMAKGINFLAGATPVLVVGFTAAVLIMGVYKFMTLATAAAQSIMAAKTILVAKGFKIQAIAAIIAAKGTMALGTALAIATGGITIIIGLLVALVAALLNMKTSAEKATERIKKLQVEMFNLNKEIKDFEGLLNRFQELENKVFKTNEELEEMEQLLSKISEFGGEQQDFVLAGRLDLETVKLFLEAKKAEQAEALQKIREEGKQATISLLRGLEQTPETLKSIVEHLASTVEGFDNFDTNKQNRIRNMISQDIEGFATEFTPETEETFFQKFVRIYTAMNVASPLSDDVSVSNVIYDDSLIKMKDDALSLMDEFEKIFETGLESADAVALFDRFVNLNPSDKTMIKQAFSNELSDILAVGEDRIRNFLSQGYNLSQIQTIVRSVENALSGFEGMDMNTMNPDIGHASGMGEPESVSGADIATFYADELSKIKPDDFSGLNEAINKTIAEIRRTAPSFEEGEKAVRDFINAVTDPMAFQTAINTFKSTASSITALSDASKAYAEGTIPENIESLVSQYPQLAQSIMDGTLTTEQAMEAAAASSIASLQSNLNQLKQQESTLTGRELEIVQAQIAIIEDMMQNPDFLLGKFLDDQIKAVEDRYKTEMDFIKELNSEKQKEIDLEEKKLNLNKSMLDLDRQIAALSRDTSFGAQATARSLQEQQRSQAIEREKFVMDLITDQAVAQLEKDSQEAVINIKDDVRSIAKALGVKKTNTVFEAATGNDISILDAF